MTATEARGLQSMRGMIGDGCVDVGDDMQKEVEKIERAEEGR